MARCGASPHCVAYLLLAQGFPKLGISPAALRLICGPGCPVNHGGATAPRNSVIFLAADCDTAYCDCDCDTAYC